VIIDFPELSFTGMRIVCLPVSGGAFVSQIAAVSRLSETGFFPDVCYSSSGGNVAAYVAAIADWKWAKIELIASELNSAMLVSTWSQVAFLAPLIGYFKGGFYNHGTGVLDLFKKYCKNEIIRKYEIWTGTYNSTRQQVRFFCNLCEVDSKFKMQLDKTLFPVMDPYYMNEDMELISKVCVASASIPTSVPPQSILGEDYVDGGVGSASPLSFVSRTIEKNVGDSPVHLWYINCANLNSPSKYGDGYNLLDNVNQTVADLMTMQAVADRNQCHLLLESLVSTSGVTPPSSSASITSSPDPALSSSPDLSSVIRYKEGRFGSPDAKRLCKVLENIHYAMIEVYPESAISINMVNFNGTEVRGAVTKSYGLLMYRLWYLPPSDLSKLAEVEKGLKMI
jgi:predicted acylesterase/phospholipase RssA